MSGVFPGVRIGHWTDPLARTGCTVVLLPEGTVGSGEVRGGAPATRELSLLEPGRRVQHVDAVLLTGGSAFGLAAADGVSRVLEAAGRGVPTPAGPVPIVVALGIYDLGVGDPSVRPGPEEGEAACSAAAEGHPATGPVGVGAGATVGNWRGADHVRPGGVGWAIVVEGGVRVAALVVVNAYGDVVAAGAEPPSGGMAEPGLVAPGTSTTVGVVLTDAALDKLGCRTLAEGAHDGLARAVHPPHTSADGDAFVAAAVAAPGGGVDAPLDHVRTLTVGVVAAAIRAAVRPAGDPGRPG
jgi:L-aminopeptidase/D-esterase-like protein